MKTPAFWNEKPGPLAWLLSPLGWMYGRVTSWRMNRLHLSQLPLGQIGEALTIPVICVGNFTAGGAGKTPTVAHLADLLTAMGERPFILSRGYGGSLDAPTLIDPTRHRSGDCGDEPLLLARYAPTIVARDRLVGARFAQNSGASIIIMDDGLQSPGIAKDLTIAVVDGVVGVGNGYCIPAGPLRAPLSAQIAHVDAVLWIGGEVNDADRFMSMTKSECPMLLGTLVPSDQSIASLRGLRLLAFAGIGRPQKFFETLRAADLDVQETQSFADHHAYSDQEIAALRVRSTQAGLQLVTTEKDWVRLKASGEEIAVVPVTLVTDDSRLISLISDAIHRKHSAISSLASA